MPQYTRRRKYYPKSCSDEMTFEECEMAILREAIQEGDKEANQKLINTPDVRDMISIVEKFISDHKLVCYGGTAINNILPKKDQFYDLSKEVPDYDFFSKTALEHAKQLADIFYQQGYANIEAKSGVHHGTYKVFVNFIPIADITQMPEIVFEAISKESVVVNKIHYCPPNYLRMAMFLELSRPKGDTTRWEKVLTRLNLLNKHYPLLSKRESGECENIPFQRESMNNSDSSEDIFRITRDVLIEDGVVFFGGYAASIYSKYMPSHLRATHSDDNPDFDVLSTDITKTSKKVYKALISSGYEDVTLVQHRAIGEILPEHIEVRVGNKPIAFIYKPLSCHSYNSVRINDSADESLMGQTIHVATIDTLLSFYLAFIYSGKEYYHRDRILCIAEFLFELMRKNRLAQKGLLKRFTMNCYGKAETLDSIRNKKTRMFNLLKNKKNTQEYEEWFLKYDPAAIAKKKGLKRNIKTRRVSKPSSGEQTSTPLEKTEEITGFEEDEEEKEKEDADTETSSSLPQKQPKRNTKRSNKTAHKSGAAKWLDFILR